MNILFKDATTDKTCLTNIETLYHEAFPKNEQVPFPILRKKAKQPLSDLLGIYDELKFIGLLSIVYFQDIVFIWYLAIASDQRENGYGSAILAKLSKTYKGKRMILNIECVDEQSNEYMGQMRRKQFYLKNGYHECGIKTSEYGVAYEMLYSGNNITYDEYAMLMKSYMGNSFFKLFYKDISET